ncbi:MULTISPECIES: transcription termination factor NusA [Brevibacterium]|uniref:Transcription termination/antitermination protein NusA n=3 Tax=Brevibacterium casei TaxID=33889 RepID=K9AZQ1_9MICO|nr:MULTISPECIES: transcription termination factor NusA [Brevibacterium]NJE65412.1 transcription termination/antitermination protein NusA [Brevibacterium sp. LS14]SIG97444.1 NusA antitermination factor [Mycobacteroides abscessus subsp. abscessus]EKU46995.1 transcription elongation protein NusA [Brevibacterium casei S18]KZE22800.1 transcription elongation factor NusA [Brevibacterium casei]MBE4695321.1 transcription termination/antitermination protein NusA [Brevibacterium casei]
MDIDLDVLRVIEREREIPFDTLIELIEQALFLAYQKTEGAWPDARAELDKSTGEVRIWAVEFDNDDNPIGEFDDTPSGFGRIAAQTARQVIHQRLRDVEDETLLGSFKGREGEIVSGTIQQGRDPQMVQVDLGEVEAVLPPHEQVPGEEYKHGTRLRVYIADVHKGPKGTSVTVSRTHPNLVRRLFALEAPEIADGTVEIVSLAREAGHRTKLAVRATKPGVNAKGSCIGELGSRVRAVMNELGQEKIDIVDYSDDPAKFVAHALSPAKATRVDILDAGSQESRAVVPRDQLSLAIGKEGQNARLAAKLTGWKIDIVAED